MSNAVNTVVGMRLKQRRERLGLTCEDMAHLLEIPVEQLAEFETGTRKLMTTKLIDAARLLRQPLWTFFIEGDADGPMGSGPGVEQARNDCTPGEIARLLQAFYDVKDADNRESVIALAKYYSGSGPSTI